MRSTLLLKILFNSGILTACVITAQTTVSCSCDLTVASCDPNCCCDTDCNPSDIASFMCSDSAFNEDSRLCVNELVFVNNNDSSSIQYDNGVFCIVRQRDESLNFYTDPVVISNSTEDFNAKAAEFPTFTYDLSTENTPTDAQFYKSGDTIDVRYSNGNWGKLNLPTSGIASSCLDANPASYLNNQQTSCTRRISIPSDCGASSVLNASTYYGFEVATAPISNFSSPTDFVTMVLCSGSSPDSTITTSSCYVATSVTYTISFDGTSGISSACATITTTNLSSSVNAAVQTFSVNYVSASTNTSQVQDIRSGNPGYLRGKPLRTAFGTTSTDNLTLNEDIFTLISETNGQCPPNSFSRIRFGEDKISGCLQSFNSSSPCSAIQSDIQNYLMIPTEEWNVAEFGNTEIATDQWIPLTPVSVDPQENMAIDGCANVYSGLNYTVLYANTGSLSNPQAKIVGIEVSLIKRNFRYECYGACNSEQFIEVVTSVTFVDVSSAPAILLKQRPTVDARLPSDFFFPFTSN